MKPAVLARLPLPRTAFGRGVGNVPLATAGLGLTAEPVPVGITGESDVFYLGEGRLNLI